jgi:hypothetical protein
MDQIYNSYAKNIVAIVQFMLNNRFHSVDLYLPKFKVSVNLS